MSTKSRVIQGSSLANKINLKGYQISNENKDQIFDREQIINIYSQETIDSCRSSLCTNIIQNYQCGKGRSNSYKPEEAIIRRNNKSI